MNFLGVKGDEGIYKKEHGVDGMRFCGGEGNYVWAAEVLVFASAFLGNKCVVRMGNGCKM